MIYVIAVLLFFLIFFIIDTVQKVIDYKEQKYLTGLNLSDLLNIPENELEKKGYIINADPHSDHKSVWKKIG